MPDMSPFLFMVVALSVIMLGIILHFLYNLAQPTVTRKALVLGKRKEPQMSTAKCTFEFEDGTRQEYDVSLNAYHTLKPGATGYLDTRGLVFWGFRRDEQ